MLGAFLIGLLLRLIYLYQYADSPLFLNIVGPDTSEYNTWARQILSGILIWEKVGIHAPLYPYYLALLYVGFDGIFWIRLMQLLLAMLAFFPVFLILKDLVRGDSRFRFMPYFFLLISVAYPPLMFYTGETVSEALLIPLVTLSVWMLYRSEQAVCLKRKLLMLGLAGLTLGGAIITHPLSLFFVMLEGLYLLWRLWRERKSRVKIAIIQLVIFCAAVAVIVMPVSVYNTILHGSPVLVQRNSGYNMYLGNNPDSNGGCYIWPGPDWEKVHGEAAAGAKKLGISKDQYFFRQTINFIVHQPLSWINLLIRKGLYVWNYREMAAGPDLPELKYYTAIQRNTVFSFGVIGILGLCGMGCALMSVKDRLRYRHFLLLVLATWGGLTLTVVSGRYRLMFAPGVFTFAAIAVCLLIDSAKRKKFLSRSWILLLVAAVVAVVPEPKIDHQKERAQAWTILGEAAMNSNRPDLAKFYLDLAMKSLSDWSRSYNILGKLYEKQDPALAMDYFQQAIKVEPSSPYGYMNIAGQLSLQRKYADAARYYQLALERGPSDPQVLYNYGYFMFEQKRYADAAKYLTHCLEEKPDNREAVNTLAIIHLLQGKYSEAVTMFKRAIVLDPKNYGLKVNYAAALWASGKVTEAKACIKNILEEKPGFPPALGLQKQMGQFQK